jgi:uncharacterized protein (DUF362 family)
MKVGITNRREFLKRGVTGALFLGGVRSARASAQPVTPMPGGKSRVVISRDPKLREAGSGVDSARLQKLLDRAMQSLYGLDSPLEAWKKVVRLGEVVGLKASCLAGRGISTSVPLVDAICERLQQAGVREVVIWDRLNSDLESARFQIRERGQGIRCFGNDVLGYEDDLTVYGNAGSRMSRTLTQVCDAVINLPVLKDHSITGVTIALKSMFGAIHNPNKYHISAGDPYVADVYMLPPIRQKVRLTICDATMALYEGGPSYMPQWTWPYDGLIVGLDPVAVDYTGWQIIEKKRAQVGMKSLQEARRAPHYIATAADAQHRLGTDDPRRIDLVEV